MIIAFDFDNTISKDANGFCSIMKLMESRGHKVVVVTGRKSTTYPEDLSFLKRMGFDVYFTEHKAKREYMRGIGIEVEVWVDDLPESVLNDYEGTPTTYRDSE